MTVSIEQIVEAYRSTGSVWKAGKILGICGQSVHERLRSIDYPMGSQNWTSEEEEELRSLVNEIPLAEIAARLGRPYYGIAMKVSRLGIGNNHGNRQKRKIPRGAGFDKMSCQKYIREIDATGLTVHRFARQQGLGVENLCRALERSFPDWWQRYRRDHSDLPERPCVYCETLFIPSNAKQEYCQRKCGSDARTDASYFGGERRNTIGLAEGVCQLCLRKVEKGLSSHHVWGKENDPDNTLLIAICQGCHQIVTLLGGRPFLDSSDGWERLVQLVAMRRQGPSRPGGFYASVEFEVLDENWDEFQEAE